MQIAINFLLVNTILGNINNLTIIIFFLQEKTL